MQMQPKNARSCPKCTQAWVKCVEEAWYSREAEKKGKSNQRMSTTETPSRLRRIKMIIDRLEHLLNLVFDA
jgi:hypothetical protein